MEYMEWDVLEHTHEERSNDWNISLAIIAAACLALFVYLRSYLLAILVLVATATIVLLAHRRPNMMTVRINPSGVLAGSIFYPHNSLDGFSVVTYGTHHTLILESTKMFLPLHIIPIPEEVDPVEVHMYCAQYLPEKELQEPWLHLILERLGI